MIPFTFETINVNMNINFNYPTTMYKKEMSIHTMVMYHEADKVVNHTFNNLFLLPEIRIVVRKYIHTLQNIYCKNRLPCILI